MRVVLLLSLLCFASAQYFSLVTHDGRAISLSNHATHAYLQLAEYDMRNMEQQWMFVSAASVGLGPGLFVVNRMYAALSFDVSGAIAANSRLSAWERKTTTKDTANQRFSFNFATGMLSPVGNNNTVVGTSSGDIRLEALTSASSGLQYILAPPSYVIRFYGVGVQINVSFTNTPLANLIIPATASFIDKELIEQTEFVAADPAGKSMVPILYSVTRNDSITYIYQPSLFTQPTSSPTFSSAVVPTQRSTPPPTVKPTQPPTTQPVRTGSTCTDGIMNTEDNTMWNLQTIASQFSISLWDIAASAFFQVDFCGLSSCGSRSVACSLGKSLGRIDNAQFSYAAGRLIINVTGGTADILCPARRSSGFTLTCKEIDVVSTIALTSVGCFSEFLMDVPLAFCS